MCRCQEWRPALARLAGEASPAQPWAALAWLGLDNHGGGDGGDQADGDGGGGGGGGDDGGGAACEVPEVRCSAARTQDTSHRHQPALVQPVVQHVSLHGTFRLLGWALCHLSSAPSRAVVP